MTDSLLGVYWSVMHRRPQDYEYFKRLQPSVFKIMDGGAPDYQFARDHLQGSLVVARDWDLSEQHDDMLKDPVATGRRHAEEWNQHQQRLGFDKAKTLILGINEPRVWDAGVPESLRQYTIAMCDRATELGLRVGAMQLSVGWPNNTGPDTPPNWEPWAGVDNAIRANNGALVLHEYWADNGPGELWGWWAGRSLKCPWQVPIVIGECGVDMFVKDGTVERHKRGWLGRMHPTRYAGELADYTARMSADSRFVGCCVFAADFADDDWYSFDIEPAYQAILAQPIPDVTPKPTTTHLPSISKPPTPAAAVAYVIAPAGLNLRAAPDGDILTAIPYGEQVQIVGVEQDGWLRVRYGRDEGYAAGIYISLQAPEPTPVVEPTPQPTDNFERCLRFVLKQEGGWADDPRDVGGATMKGVTIGTFTRWRQAHGQPVPSKDDLRNISDAELYQIYKEWYWDASGSGSLSWPLCLMHFNIAVNAGPERAKQFLTQSNGNFLVYVATAMEWYTRIDGWQHFGAAWTRRNAAVLREAAK